jgi:hypothetical protein
VKKAREASKGKSNQRKNEALDSLTQKAKKQTLYYKNGCKAVAITKKPYLSKV